MPAKVKSASPEAMLTRVLEGLEQDLIDATDDDITEAARDLGMDLSMKGSAAYIGLRFPIKLRLSDLFEQSGFDPKNLEALRQSQDERIRRAREELRAKGAYLPSGKKAPEK